MSDEAKTLYVGNLNQQVTEQFMHFLFSQMGNCLGCKMIYEPSQDPYCFVEFADHYSASQALATMNGREVMGKPMKVNWATSPNSKNATEPGRRVDTSDHFHIFCGDLSPDIETKQLREAFAAFGEISDCKVISDLNTGKSKGYGFISFVNKDDAQKAINEMNGAWLGNKAIRTNWATRKPPAPQEKSRPRQQQRLNYDEVFAQSSDTNCTVYLGGIQEGLTEDLLREKFAEFGQVHEIRCFTDKGFAFIRLDSKSSATAAIVGLHGAEINGYQCRCSWGKESNDIQKQQGGFGPSHGPSYGHYNNAQHNNWGAYNHPGQWGGGGHWGGQPQQPPPQQWGGQWGAGGDPTGGWQQQGYGAYPQQQGYDYGSYNNYGNNGGGGY